MKKANNIQLTEIVSNLKSNEALLIEVSEDNINIRIKLIDFYDNYLLIIGGYHSETTMLDITHLDNEESKEAIYNFLKTDLFEAWGIDSAIIKNK